MDLVLENIPSMKIFHNIFLTFVVKSVDLIQDCLLIKIQKSWEYGVSSWRKIHHLSGRFRHCIERKAAELPEHSYYLEDIRH